MANVPQVVSTVAVHVLAGSRFDVGFASFGGVFCSTPETRSQPFAVFAGGAGAGEEFVAFEPEPPLPPQAARSRAGSRTSRRRRTSSRVRRAPVVAVRCRAGWPGACS